jgi:hypothetical protein
VILSPQEYSGAPAGELLEAAARGQVPLDHRLIRALAARGGAVMEEAARFRLDPREGDRVRLRDFLLGLARLLRTPAALPFLAQYARAVQFDFPDDLAEAFVELGAASVETLLALHAESGGAIDVGLALAMTRVRDPRILQALLATLRQDAVFGAIVLEAYGDPAARPALEEALARVGDNEWQSQQVGSAIETLASPPPPAPEPEPFDLWPHYPAEAAPLFEALDDAELIEFFSSPVPQYRAQAIQMLTAQEPVPPIAARILGMAQNDPESLVRAMAWECLEGVDDPPGIPALLRAKLNDASAPAEERAGALVALAREAPKDEALRRLILEFFALPGTRERAVKAMWHSGDRRFEPQIVAALEDSESGVLQQAITAAGMFRMTSQLGRLEAWFDDDNLREPALYAYALAAPSPATPAHMRKLFKKIESLAGGLDDSDGDVVGAALDARLEANGRAPIFTPAED